jgi:hypothetical protein
MYHEFHMRRGLSIFLILFFWLGPLAVALPGEDESGLPACCRRHGAHHCAMAMQMAARMAQGESGGGPVFSAPMTCPYFPGFVGATATTTYALIALQTGLPALLAQPHSPAAGRAAARLSQMRRRASRGPPALIQS